MTEILIEPIQRQDPATQAALLELNNAHAQETSFLTAAQWQNLLDNAFLATCAAGTGGLLIVLDQDADYDNVNLNWFRERFDRFVYVDRIVISQQLRGAGAANRLYEDLFELARSSGHERVVCEVNLDPPNPGSDKFHAKLDFDEVGRATLEHNGKTVRYLAKTLG